MEEVQRCVPAQKKKLRTYQKISNEYWAAVGKHVAEHCNKAAVHHFSKDYEKPVTENTVRMLKEEERAALQ